MGISALVCGSAGTDNAESTALGFGKGVDSEGGRAVAFPWKAEDLWCYR